MSITTLDSTVPCSNAAYFVALRHIAFPDKRILDHFSNEMVSKE